MINRIILLLARLFGTPKQSENTPEPTPPMEPYFPVQTTEAPPTSLIKRMFNVDNMKLNFSGKLGNSHRNQVIFHFNPPNGLADRRLCGIPIKIVVPQTGETIHTYLIPQWRFGKGMRTGKIRELMRGKKTYHFTEEDGNIVMTLS